MGCFLWLFPSIPTLLLKVHAKNTEDFLVGKRLIEEGTLQEALKKLAQELHPDEDPLGSSSAYRVLLSQALLYKVSH